MIGINLSGAEFGSGTRYGWDYIYPSASDIEKYAERGVTFVRLPVRWERLQPTLERGLDQAEVGRLKEFLANADNAGVKVLVDLHSYGGYWDNKIGGDLIPVQMFADFWTDLASEIKDSPALAGYDLMNEPYGFPDWESWPRAAQAAVDAIRELDMEHDIYVEGDQMASSHNWSHANPLLDIKDPANKIVYEAHVYFDRWGSGTSFGTVAEEGVGLNIGAERIANFVAWLKERDARGFIGEFAVPNTDPAWLVVLDNFLQEMEKHGLTGTYWGGGPWWGSYPLAPLNSDGTPRSQMAVLEKYFGEFETPADETSDVSVVVPVVVPAGVDHVATDRVEHFTGDEGKGAVSYVKSTAAVDVDLARDIQHGGAAEGDTLTGIATVTGSAFADTLSGSAAADVLKGGDGNDVLVGTAGGDTLDGGAGSDTADYSRASGFVAVNLGYGFTEQGDTLVSIENANGSAFADWLVGGDADNIFRGRDGNDELHGNRGDDALYGEDGNDHALGGDGNDYLEGGDGNDELGGDAGDDRILGGAGNDALGGNNGLNTLEGGTGDDHYYVEIGTDIIVENAGEGWDTAHSWVSYALSAEIEGIELMGNEAASATGNDLDNWVVGNGAGNVLNGMGGRDEMRGGGGDDTMNGGAGNDRVLGGDGNDRVEGGDGDDEVGGDAGNDHIIAGAGNDHLGGNQGADTLEGGAGADTFWYDFVWESASDAPDHIADFEVGVDKIEVSHMDANVHWGGNQSFTFLGTAEFSRNAGELRYQTVDGSAHVQADLDGDGQADFSIVLDHVAQIKASDLHL